MIKRWAIFILTLVLFTTTATAENTCQNQDDIILRLSSATNAHAELYSQTTPSYDEEICFSDFFNDVIPPRATCNSTNTILKLAAATNAHAENPTQSNYSTNVCYGDLECEVKSSCITGETAILKLSSETNAHLENASQSNYPHSLCCAVGGLTSSTLYWQNSSGSQVSTIRFNTTLGSTTEIWTYISNYNGNLTGNDDSFNITEKDDIGFDQMINKAGSLSGQNWKLKWVINDTGELENTADYKNFTFEINNTFSPQLEITFCGDGETQLTYGEQCDDGPTGSSICNTQCRYTSNSDKQWFDLNGNPITNADQGDTVELRYINMQTTDDFVIKEKDPFFHDSVATIQSSNNSQNTTAIWTIPTGTLGDNLEDPYELYFEIGGGEDSDILNVSADPNNDDPTGDFITPTCGTDLSNGTQQDINFTVSDPDSLLDITLTVNEVDVFSQTSFQGGTFSYSHLFTTESGENGITEIILRASETNGQGKVKATSNVIVYNTTNGARYVAACIKEPKDYSNIVTDYTFFNASTTRALNYSSTSNSVSDLPFSDLYFNWNFSDGRTHPDNDGANLISREFHKYFNQFGDNWANLEVIFK